MPAKKAAAPAEGEIVNPELTVIYRDPRDLIPNPTNARTHTAETVNELAGAIQMFGWTNPILIDDADMIYAGHRRQKAAFLLKLAVVPCFDISHLTPDQRKAMMLADNRIALNAGWDLEVLGNDLRELDGKGFDLKTLGFNQDEMDAALAALGEADYPDLPDGDQPEFRQVTFTLHASQADIVNGALERAKQSGLGQSGENDNSNANALTGICTTFMATANAVG